MIDERRAQTSIEWAETRDSGAIEYDAENSQSLTGSECRSASGGDYFFFFAGGVGPLVVIGVTASRMVNVGEIASPDSTHIGSRCVEPGGMICRKMEHVSMVGVQN